MRNEENHFLPSHTLIRKVNTVWAHRYTVRKDSWPGSTICERVGVHWLYRERRAGIERHANSSGKTLKVDRNSQIGHINGWTNINTYGMYTDTKLCTDTPTGEYRRGYGVGDFERGPSSLPVVAREPLTSKVRAYQRRCVTTHEGRSRPPKMIWVSWTTQVDGRWRPGAGRRRSRGPAWTAWACGGCRDGPGSGGWEAIWNEHRFLPYRYCFGIVSKTKVEISKN